MATSAYTGNPNIARQGARARQIAQARNVSDIADPRTYGFMQGLLGSAPDELGYSVFDDPETRRAAQQAAEVGLVGGGLLQSIPVLGPALKGYGRLAAGQVNRAMMGEGGLLGPITPQPMYVVPPTKKQMAAAKTGAENVTPKVTPITFDINTPEGAKAFQKKYGRKPVHLMTEEERVKEFGPAMAESPEVKLSDLRSRRE